MTRILVGAVAVLALVLAGVAAAGKVGFVKPWVYDPGATGAATAEWTKDGLLLENRLPTGAVASGADVKGVAGERLTSLSFELKDATHCGAGAPRFSVRYENETGYRFFGCLYGSKTAGSEPGWTKVTFSDTTPYCDGSTPAPTGCFGAAPVADLFLVNDEGPTTSLLDRIEANGVVVSKYPSG
jgi:hypothetical protein